MISMNTTNVEMFLQGHHIGTVSNVVRIVQDHDKGSGCHLIVDAAGHETHAWMCELRVYESDPPSVGIIFAVPPTDLSKLAAVPIAPVTFKVGDLAPGKSVMIPVAINDDGSVTVHTNEVTRATNPASSFISAANGTGRNTNMTNINSTQLSSIAVGGITVNGKTLSETYVPWPAFWLATISFAVLIFLLAIKVALIRRD